MYLVGGACPSSQAEPRRQEVYAHRRGHFLPHGDRGVRGAHLAREIGLPPSRGWPSLLRAAGPSCETLAEQSRAEQSRAEDFREASDVYSPAHGTPPCGRLHQVSMHFVIGPSHLQTTYLVLGVVILTVALCFVSPCPSKQTSSLTLKPRAPNSEPRT